MKRVFYIDFENVSQFGLKGILKLTKQDMVRIFLGPKCSKMSLIDADTIFHCDATVELITNDQIGKNALDFIIMVHLGYDIAKKSGQAFYIISNDKGYDPAISEMKSMTGAVIERLPDVESVLSKGEVKSGLFGFLRKKQVVEDNTTTHEVIGKGQKRGTTSQTVRRSTGVKPAGGTGRSQEKNGKYTRNNDGENRNTRSGNNDRYGRNGSSRPRPATQNVWNNNGSTRVEHGNARTDAGTASADTVSRNSVTGTVAAEPKGADVRFTKDPVTKQTVAKETAAKEPVVKQSVTKQVTAEERNSRGNGKASGRSRKEASYTMQTEQEEEAIVRRGIETCRTKLEFHNYLAKEIGNKEHVKSFYDRSKSQLTIDREAVKRESGLEE